MKYEKLWLVRCQESYRSFKYGCEYIKLKKDPTNNKYAYYIDGEGLVQIVNSCYFSYSRELIESFTVISLFTSKDGTLTEDNEYSVFKTNKDETFTILNDANIFKRHHKGLFIKKELYKKYEAEGILEDKIAEKKKEYEALCEEIKKEEERIAKEEAEKKALKKLKEKEAKEKANREKFILKVIKATKENNTVVVSVEDNSNKELLNESAISNIDRNFKWLRYILSGGLGILVGGYFGKSVPIVIASTIGFNALFDIMYTCAFKLKKAPKIETKVVDKSVNSPNNVLSYKRNECLDKLDLTILGKIKKVELNIDMLEAIDGDSEIISLLKESISLTLSLNEFSDVDMSEKLNEFLDNTLEYINTLKTNRQIEEKYIREKLAENIISVIDNNNELFKSMIKDNGELNKYIIA